MRILVLSPDATDGTSFYRSFGPLSALQKSGDIEIVETGAVNWKTLRSIDLVFFQRPSNKVHLEVCEMVKAYKIPLVLDYDDNLFQIPISNPVFWDYMTDPKAQEGIKKCLRLADRVITSTKALGHVLIANGAKSVSIVPNAWDTELFYGYDTLNKNSSVLWRGSRTHDEDLWSVTKELSSAIVSNSWKLNLIGGPFWMSVKYFVENKAQLDLFEKLELSKMITKFKELSSSVMVVPLVDCPFNLAKSNCSWIEGTMTGHAVLAPDMPEFIRPGITNYIDAEDFKYKLNLLIKNPELREQNFKASHKFINDNLMLPEVNKMRLAIFDEMIKK